MSTSKDPSTSSGSKKGEGCRARNIIGVSQSASESVDDYKSKFFEEAKRLDVLGDEMLMVKWFRDGLREDIKAQIPKTTTTATMDHILERAYLVESRVETIPPEESVDKFIVSSEYRSEDEEEPEEDPEEDPAENPAEGDDLASWHGDYSMDSRDWLYDDLDDWGFGTPPH